MDKYHLYLDESETHINGTNRIFCLAGIIVKEDDFNTVLKPRLDNLKQQVFHDLTNPTDYILHEKDIRSAQKNKMKNINPEFRRFKQAHYSRMLYNELEQIVQSSSCKVIGSCIHMDDLNKHFNKKIVSQNYLIAFQIILENFCHFLERVNGTGHVFYESRDEKPDSIVRMQFNHVKAMGSMYVNPYAMQRHIREIDFPNKLENNAGLQIADFIPNPFARKVLEKKQYKFNIYKTLRLVRYDGGIYKGNRFGIKVMP